MAHRLSHVIWVSLVGASALLVACSDDATDGTNDSSAGESSGGDASGSASGGSSAGKGGSTSGGKAGAGTAGTTPGGEGGASSEGGAAAGGEPALGGAAGDAYGGDGGAEMGGAGGLEYTCKTTAIVNELCSALVAANCSAPTDCADCVQTRAGERAAFADCPACLAQNDAFFQCGIDAYESGNLSAGIECYEGFGADLNDNCLPHLNEAIACSDYALENGCPQGWPVD